MEPIQAETRPVQEGRLAIARRAKLSLKNFSEKEGIERDVNSFKSPDEPLRLAEEIANLGPDIQSILSQIDIELVDGVSIRARKLEGAESATTVDPNRRVIAATFKGEKPKGREPIPDHVMFAGNVKHWFDQGATDKRFTGLSKMTKAEVVRKIKEGVDNWVPFSEKVRGPVGKAIRAGALAGVVTSAGLIHDNILPPQSTVDDGAAATQVTQEEGIKERYEEAGLVGGGSTPGETDDEGKETGGEGSEATPGPTPTPETTTASTTEAFYNDLMDGIEAGVVDKKNRYFLTIGKKGVYQGRIVIFTEPVIDQNGKEVLIAITRNGPKSFSPTTLASDPEHPINISKDVVRNFIKGEMDKLKQKGEDFLPYGQASLAENHLGEITTLRLEDPNDPEHRIYHFDLKPNPLAEKIEEAMEKSQKAAGLEKGKPPQNLFDALRARLNPQQTPTSPPQPSQ